MNLRLALWYCLFIPWSFSCASDAVVDRHVEGRLTISNGVYGQTTSQDDVGDNPVEYHPMTLYVSSQGDSEHLATVTSDEVGFYEIPLSPGKYSICVSFGRCSDFELADQQCVRLDYEFSVGPGWSMVKTIPCPP